MLSAKKQLPLANKSEKISKKKGTPWLIYMKGAMGVIGQAVQLVQKCFLHFSDKQNWRSDVSGASQNVA